MAISSRRNAHQRGVVVFVLMLGLVLTSSTADLYEGGYDTIGGPARFDGVSACIQCPYVIGNSGASIGLDNAAGENDTHTYVKVGWERKPQWSKARRTWRYQDEKGNPGGTEDADVEGVTSKSYTVKLVVMDAPPYVGYFYRWFLEGQSFGVPVSIFRFDAVRFCRSTYLGQAATEADHIPGPASGGDAEKGCIISSITVRKEVDKSFDWAPVEHLYTPNTPGHHPYGTTEAPPKTGSSVRFWDERD